MCLSDRNTDRRGRSGLPKMLARMLHLRRSSRFCLSLFLSAMILHLQFAIEQTGPIATCTLQIANPFLLRTRAGKRLAWLDLDLLAFVTDALALVRLGLAHATEVAGELADELLVGAGHVNLVRAFEGYRQ